MRESEDFIQNPDGMIRGNAFLQRHGRQDDLNAGRRTDQTASDRSLFQVLVEERPGRVRRFLPIFACETVGPWATTTPTKPPGP